MNVTAWEVTEAIYRWLRAEATGTGPKPPSSDVCAAHSPDARIVALADACLPLAECSLRERDVLRAYYWGRVIYRVPDPTAWKLGEAGWRVKTAAPSFRTVARTCCLPSPWVVKYVLNQARAKVKKALQRVRLLDAAPKDETFCLHP